jgi:hypothetical protein
MTIKEVSPWARLAIILRLLPEFKDAFIFDYNPV